MPEVAVGARSYLYVPADAEEKLAKAGRFGADALIVDLEDAVAPDRKQAAREIAAGFVAEPREQEIWVRVNPGEDALDDVTAVLGRAVSGVILAKTESAGEVDRLAECLAAVEADRGLPQTPIVPLLESAAALLDAREIARAERVVRLQLGEADFTADVGITSGFEELLTARSQLVLVSAAMRLGAPVAPVSTNFRDLEALTEETCRLARLGFFGRGCIHPAQIDVANTVFTPSEDEVAAARDVVDRMTAAVAAGSGVAVDARGRMIDEAVARKARRVLSAAQR